MLWSRLSISHSRTRPWSRYHQYIITRMCLCLMVGCLLFLGTACADGTQPPGSRLFMRGTIFVSLRINNTDVPQNIDINKDKKAIRTRNPVDSVHRSTYVLSESEYQQVLDLRQQWCTTAPHFRSPGHLQTNYDVGFRCSEREDNYDVTQFSVPIDELPAIFTTIEQQLPRLPELEQETSWMKGTDLLDSVGMSQHTSLVQGGG